MGPDHPVVAIGIDNRATTITPKHVQFFWFGTSAPFVGDHANDDNLLQKGRPLIMRFRQPSLPVELTDDYVTTLGKIHDAVLYNWCITRFPFGSPAIDTGNPNGCTDGLGHLLKRDQRGQPRPDKEDTGGCW